MRMRIDDGPVEEARSIGSNSISHLGTDFTSRGEDNGLGNRAIHSTAQYGSVTPSAMCLVLVLVSSSSRRGFGVGCVSREESALACLCRRSPRGGARKREAGNPKGVW